jgi:porphobilinogen synthase
MAAGFPQVRPRRLRRTAAIRRLVAQTSVQPSDLVLPLFVKEGIGEPQPVPSMPGVVQHTRDSLRKAAVEATAAGVGGLVLFGVPAVKDGVGSAADDPAGILNLALGDLAAELGDATVLMADLCLDEYTDHGHCGVLTPAGAVRRDRRGPGRGGRPRGRAERDDGRAGSRDPGRARRGRLPRRGDLRVLGEVRLRVLRAVPRRG